MAMKVDRGGATALALRSGLGWAIGLSLLTCLATMGVSAVGIVARDRMYAPELRAMFAANDAVNLCVGAPVLLACAGMAWARRLAGVLCLPGALLYVLYNETIYTIALPAGWALGLHLVVLSLCAYALVAAMTLIDLEGVRERLEGRTPARLAGGVLAGLGVLFLARAIGVLVEEMGGLAAIERAKAAVDIADFLFTPAWVAAGVLLWRRRALGYAAGPAVLFQASLLFVGLIAYMMVLPVFAGGAVKAVDLAVVAAMSLVCLAPMGMVLRGMGSAPNCSR
jgi:hypothetical protein